MVVVDKGLFLGEGLNWPLVLGEWSTEGEAGGGWK